MQVPPFAVTLVGLTPMLTPSGAGDWAKEMRRVMGLLQEQLGFNDATFSGRYNKSLQSTFADVTAGLENCSIIEKKSEE